MRGQVVEITTTRDVWLQAPWQFAGGVIVQFSGRSGKPYLHVGNIANAPFAYDFFDALEVRQVAAIVGHIAGHSCLLAYGVDAYAVVIACSLRLFHIYRLACTHRHNGKSGMT